MSGCFRDRVCWPWAAWLTIVIAGCGSQVEAGRTSDTSSTDGDTASDSDTDSDSDSVSDSVSDSDSDVDVDVDVDVDGDVDVDVNVNADVDVDVNEDVDEDVDEDEDEDEDVGVDVDVDVDVNGDVEDAGPACVEGDPCPLTTWVPQCYEGRCSSLGTCVPARIDGCCLTDADCGPAPLGACEASRCLQSTCTIVQVPGCCDPLEPAACDDGLETTDDVCDESASRCTHCAPPCPGQPPLFAASFDGEADTPAALGLTILDGQPADAITWTRTEAAFAAGGGAVYLGDPRCTTYYSGALDADCQPVQATEQDSARVVVSLLTPPLALPPDRPALLTVLVRARVEPLANLGAAEPDVMKVLVESFTLAPVWTVASTLDLGKSTDWAPLAVDLAPWRGQTVRVRFELDTLDGERNRFEGLWLDELVVREACALGGCCEADADCAASSPCVRGACLLTAQGAARLCVEVPVSPGAPCTACDSDAACADDDPCTADACLPSGVCAHETFCCLERDLFAEPFDGTLGALDLTDPNPDDGVAWHVRDGAAWFGDPATGTYATGGPVSGSLTTPRVTLPSGVPERARATLNLTVTLSTEWDLAEPGAPWSNPAGLDRLVVTLADGPHRTTLWTSDAIAGTTLGAPLQLALDLSRWLGRSVAIEVTFDSGDETLNTFAGPSIDDLVIGLRCQ